MKVAVVKISEVMKHPTMRLDAKYWIDKKTPKVKAKNKVKKRTI